MIRVKKVQLSDSVQGFKSPLRATKHVDNSSVSYIKTSTILDCFFLG